MDESLTHSINKYYKTSHSVHVNKSDFCICVSYSYLQYISYLFRTCSKFHPINRFVICCVVNYSLGLPCGSSISSSSNSIREKDSLMCSRSSLRVVSSSPDNVVSTDFTCTYQQHTLNTKIWETVQTDTGECFVLQHFYLFKRITFTTSDPKLMRNTKAWDGILVFIS